MTHPEPNPDHLGREAVKFLERDFNQCFEQMRHYESMIVSICKFMFTGHAALVGISSGLYQYSLDKGVDLGLPVILVLVVGLVFGLAMFCLLVRGRVHYVFVTRYVNEHRHFFLRQKPLGFQNVAGMYTNPSQPPVFNPRSSQLLLALLGAILNSVLACALVFMANQTCPKVWHLALGAAGAFLTLEVLCAVAYLRSREGKSASKAVFGKGREVRGR